MGGNAGDLEDEIDVGALVDRLVDGLEGPPLRAPVDALDGEIDFDMSGSPAQRPKKHMSDTVLSSPSSQGSPMPSNSSLQRPPSVHTALWWHCVVGAQRTPKHGLKMPAHTPPMQTSLSVAGAPSSQGSFST